MDIWIFRAWDVQSGCWAHIDLDEWNTSVGPRASIDNQYVPQQFELHSDEFFIWQACSGIKDVTGRKIFEGDILEGFKRELMLVEFIEGQFVVSLHPLRGESPRLNALRWVASGSRVVGNMFENKGLAPWSAKTGEKLV